MSNKLYYRRIIETIIVIMVISVITLLIMDLGIYFISSILFGLSPIILFYGFTRPYFFCLVFYVFSIFRLHEVMPVLYPYQIPFISAALGVLSLIISVLFNKTTLYWQKEMRYFLLFFIFITLGVPLSYNFELSYAFWSKLFLKIGIIFFMMTWAVTDKAAYKSIIFVTITCGVFISLITIYNQYYGIALVEGSRAIISGQPGSLLSDPNDLALILLFPFSFCCSLFNTKSTSIFLRLSGIFSSILITYAIIVTESRGGMLGLFGVISYFLSRRFKSKFLLIFIIIGVGVLLFLANSSMRQPGGAGEALDESAMGRIHAWEAAINMALHHPIWGVGLDAFKDSLFNYAIVWEHVNLAVHSSWFGVLAEGGFVGFALFITCVYHAMKLAHRNINIIESLDSMPPHTLNIELILAQSLFSGLIGFCISSTFLTQGFAWPFYIFFALSISLTHNIIQLLKKNTKEADEI